MWLLTRRLCDDITAGHTIDAGADGAELERVLALTNAAFNAPPNPAEDT